MANAFTTYAAAAPADAGRARAAALVDLAAGSFLGILIWPFPVMRILTTDLAGSVLLGWAAHVAMLLVFMVCVAAVAAAAQFTLLGRSVGMYLNDLGFRDGSPGWGGALSAAVAWTAASLAGVAGARGPAGAVAGRLLGSTGRPAGD